MWKRGNLDDPYDAPLCGDLLDACRDLQAGEICVLACLGPDRSLHFEDRTSPQLDEQQAAYTFKPVSTWVSAQGTTWGYTIDVLGTVCIRSFLVLWDMIHYSVVVRGYSSINCHIPPITSV